MIDLKFIKFYLSSLYDKSIEEHFNVKKSTVSNWKKRGMPKKYLNSFIESEGSDNINELFKKIYPMNKLSGLKNTIDSFNNMFNKLKEELLIDDDIINNYLSSLSDEEKQNIDPNISIGDLKKLILRTNKLKKL